VLTACAFKWRARLGLERGKRGRPIVTSLLKANKFNKVRLNFGVGLQILLAREAPRKPGSENFSCGSQRLGADLQKRTCAQF
jgi:hypothetical protein